MYHNVVGLYKKRFEYMTVSSSHIDPHFLRNSGATIQALIKTDPQSASDYLAKFVAFLIETQQNSTSIDITIDKELIHLHHYMEFQQLRFKDQIEFDCDVPSSILEYSLPPRSLQTLVENALTHGKRGLTHPSSIKRVLDWIGCDTDALTQGKRGLTRPLSIIVRGKETKNRVILTVQDNGCGIPSERLPLLTKQIVESEYSNGTALYYLQKMLDLAFGSAKLTINSAIDQGTTVTLDIPKEIMK